MFDLKIGKVYSGCGETKGCVVLPEDCTNDCSAIFTYKKLNSTIVELEVYGKANSNAYVAFGFSADRKMVRVKNVYEKKNHSIFCNLGRR